MIEYAALFLAAIVATLAAVEAVRYLPLGHAIGQMRRTGMRAVFVLRSRAISEHWKERVLPVYAMRLFRSALVLLLCILALAVAYVAPFGLICMLLLDEADWTSALMRPDVLVLSVAVAFISLWLRPLRKSHG